MSRSALQRYVLPTAIIIAGFAVIISLSGFIESKRPALPEGYGDTELSLNGSNLKGYTFGAEGLMADWYFMRALQYIGDKMLKRQNENFNVDDLRDLNPRLLYPLLKNATDLDPHFIVAYSYGAMLLPAIDAEKAIELTTQGVINNPDSWRLRQHLAFTYWKLGRYADASENYEKGSQIPGSPPFMKLMAGAMKTEGGSRETARSIYREMLASSDDEQVRITAKRRLNQIDALDETDAIDKALADFKQRNGHCVDSLGEIGDALAEVKLPDGNEFEIDRRNQIVDPTGMPYLLNKAECKVVIDVDHSGLPGKFK